MIQRWLKEQNWFSILILIAVTIAIMLPVYQFRVLQPVNSDFGTHIEFTSRFLKHETIPAYTLAHPVYQLLLGGIVWLSRGLLNGHTGTILIMVASQVVTALLVYGLLGKKAGRRSEICRVILSVGVVVAAPIMALLPLDNKYYFGYIGLANYHNPTIILLRPLALILFGMILADLQKRKLSTLRIILAAVVVIVSTLLKPNLAITLIPAVFILLLIHWIQKKPFHYTGWMLGYFLPAGIILAGQYLFTYLQPGAGSGGILFQPLVVESAFSGYLGWKFLLSIFFPLLILIVEFKQIKNSPDLQLAWLAFIIGAAQLYLLAEDGNRLEHGNFRWSAQITLFLLFVSTLKYCWQKIRWTSAKKWLILIGFSPHVIAGVIYLIHCLKAKSYG